MSNPKGRAKFSVGDLVGLLGRKAPFDLAEEWDNVGFLVGDAAETVIGIVVAVNLGPEALSAAAKAQANVIVVHHPPIFKPISRITRSATPYLYEAIKKGLSVIALHTNFDLSSETTSRRLAVELGCEMRDFAAPRSGSEVPQSVRLGKFITYVPESHLDAVREVACKAGAGGIGNYTQCSFSWDGEGTFLGGAGANPTVGKAGGLERVKERRLELVFPWKLRDQVVRAARQAHPYEEMAYDLLALEQPNRPLGYGFVGEFADHLAFHKLLDGVKHTFQLRSVTVVGPGLSDSDLRVRKVAFSPGSGSSFIGSVAGRGADVYICGEVGYHQMLEARQKGLTLVILGHSYSERFFVETVAEWCMADEANIFGETVAVNKVFETIHDVM